MLRNPTWAEVGREGDVYLVCFPLGSRHKLNQILSAKYSFMTCDLLDFKASLSIICSSESGFLFWSITFSFSFVAGSSMWFTSHGRTVPHCRVGNG